MGTFANHHERIADGYLAPSTARGVASDRVLDKIQNNNKTNSAYAIHAYVLARPGMTHADLEHFLTDPGANCTLSVVDANEVDINVQQTLMGLEGNMDEIYALQFNLLDLTTDGKARRRLHAVVPSKHLVAAGYIISHDELPTGTRTNAQPLLSAVAPGESVTLFGTGFGKSSASSGFQVPTPTAASPVTLPARPVATTQGLASSKNTSFSALPSSFNVDAYNSPGSNAHSQSVIKDGGGLVSSSSTGAEFRLCQCLLSIHGTWGTC